jgi:hypothetical protein
MAVALSLCPLWARSQGERGAARSFVQSSIRMKHPDKQVRPTCSSSLSERLDARAIEEMQGLGAGPAAVEALQLAWARPACPPRSEARENRAHADPPSRANQKAILERVASTRCITPRICPTSSALR